jgi:hypothetical protein
MRSLSLLLLVVSSILLATPRPALAGSFAVTACFGLENASWAEVEPSPFVTAYTACPGGVVDVARPWSGEGLLVRNVVGGAPAPRGAWGAFEFAAPAGTSIAGLDFDARMLSNPGWHAGVRDVTRRRWLWCGAGCGSSVGLWIHRELRGLATQRVQALVRCAAARCSRSTRHAFIALRNVRVLLDDPSPARIGAPRGGLLTAGAGGSGWLRGSQDVAFDASDDSGVSSARIALDGREIASQPRRCDFTRRVPCPDGPFGARFETRGWPDGQHVLRLVAFDAAGNPATVERTVRVDNTAPGEPGVMLEGGDGWSAARDRVVVLTPPGGQAAPLARALVRICRRGGACEPDAYVALRAGQTRVPVAPSGGPGEFSVRLALADAAGNAGAWSVPLTLRFDDARPAAPDLSAADAWHAGGTVALALSGPPGSSGLRGFDVLIGDRPAALLTGGIALGGLPEGVTPVQVSAISGAGVASSAVRASLKVDRTPPVVASGPVPPGWSRAPVTVALSARDQPGLSGVRSLAYRVDGGAEEVAAGDAAAVPISLDGRHSLRFHALDGAGNVSAESSVAVAVDRTPPETVAFEATDPADPRRVSVVVADRTSGIVSGTIELRRTGAAWQPLRTLIARDRLVALLDDAALRPGAYELRARAVDGAGNEALGTGRVDGAPARLTLPLRRPARLTLRRTGRRVSARLSAGGAPLAGREVALRQRLRGRTTWHSLCPLRTVVVARNSCMLRTDAAGRIAVRLAAGPSRTLRLVFSGDALLLPASATLRLHTPARARLTARPAVVTAGAAVTFAGRLLGGHVPRGGKLVALQARVGRRWRTFTTVRTDRRGRLRARHRFSAASRGRSYRFRLLVPHEPSYPFERAASAAIAVRVL